ncbi:hypothetical protein [Halobacterium hubeiense]|uniref:hypothetical protein n=1 Tax=Halobacterium hubeiense TaxID=1407499 RepID=UPI003C7224A9
MSADVHGGDLFHTPGDGIHEDEIAVCPQGLTKLAEHGIPFSFIYRNHERHTGRRLMRRGIDDGPAVHLGPRYEGIQNTVALYDSDHTPDWDKHVFDLEHPPENHPTILCVHQSMAPFTASTNPDCSIQNVLHAPHIPLDVVVTGHTHARSEHRHNVTRLMG